MGFFYDFNLVPLSVIVAMMASYIALDLAGRVTLTEGRAARYWLLGGAVAMGAGIWSMHFIGMLAVRMPIPLGYDPALTAASLLIAVMTSGFALALVSRKTLGAAPLAVGAVIMGAGICGMHYTGMAAMQMAPAVRYDPLLFAASVLIAVAASLAALWLAFTLRTAATRRLSLLKVLSALIMGIAISGMHYTGMEAARFAPGSVCTAAVRLPADSSYLGYGIGAMILVILSLTLLASLFDARLGARTALLLSQLRESAERYRTLLNTSTDAVLLVDEGGIIRYANTTVERVFGHRPQEVIGQPLLMLQPERLHQKYQQGFRRYLETHLRELDWRIIELPGLRRDGREIPLEMSFSEIELEGQHLFAAFIRDISERKERDRKIARLNRVQAVLSGIDGLIVRAKGQQELFDGSCQVAVGQGDFLLAWIGMVEGDIVRPVAAFGRNDGYIENNVNISLSGRDPRGRGPTASALRELRPRVCNDIATDPDFAPWRDAALARGFRSSAALPLRSGSKLVGCLCLYAAEAHFFDDEELRLLRQLAGDISHALEFIARADELEYLAYYDALTGLANRRLFSDRLSQAVQAAHKDGEQFAVIMLDLVNFKSVNDTLGMPAGDLLLQRVARRLTHYAGRASRLARIGGDRFAAVVPDFHVQNPTGIVLRERIWEGMNRPYQLHGEWVRVSARIGIAVFPEDGDDAESLIQNAEAALKKAKASSENVLFYTQQMSAALKERLHLEGQLRHAVEESEFELYYQPKLDLRTGAISGAEALLRWNSPELGLVPPARFIPLLEETGLIVKVGRWLLLQASSDRQAWSAAGLRAPRVAVNVSPLQLRQPGFVDDVRAAIAGQDRQAVGIGLEVTESVLLPDMEQHIAKLQQLRELGVTVSIDDFGTGYSSLSRLSSLPVDEVKIDQSFIAGMSDSASTMNIVSTIISLSRSMNLKVVAEGVDTPEQLKFLRLLRCDEMQGFLFSKGLPADEFAQLLREGRHLGSL